MGSNVNKICIEVADIFIKKYIDNKEASFCIKSLEI